MGVSTAGLKPVAKKYTEELLQKFAVNSVEVISGLYDELVENTPKDTGEAMASWHLEYDDPSPAVNRKSLAAPRNATKAQKAAKHIAIMGFQKNLKLQKLPIFIEKMKTGSKLYITNGARHIRLLEYQGISGQAPAGWVRIAVRKAKMQLKKLNVRVNLLK